MPGGKKDSSKTRVVPVFEELAKRPDDWVRTLLSIPRHPGIESARIADLDLRCVKRYWGADEHPFPPPTRLLKWLVQHPQVLRHSRSSHEMRDRLLTGDADALQQALAAIEATPNGRGWHLLEGTTFPDATIFTRDAVIVVEGKRTEAGPTLDTSWLEGRHQIWRHIEGAWGMRGARRVFGFFLVEEVSGGLPQLWKDAASQTVDAASLASSFPHLSLTERSELATCFIGVATWQQVCREFGIDPERLPNTVDDLRAGA